MSNDELFTAEDVAAKIKGVTPDWVLRHTREQKWPHVRFSAKNIRFTQAQFDAIVAKHDRTPEVVPMKGLPGQTASSRSRAS